MINFLNNKLKQKKQKYYRIQKKKNQKMLKIKINNIQRNKKKNQRNQVL